MPNGEKRKSNSSPNKMADPREKLASTANKEKQEKSKASDSMATPSKFKISYQRDLDKKNRAKVNKAREDVMLRSTGRKKVASNYKKDGRDAEN